MKKFFKVFLLLAVVGFFNNAFAEDQVEDEKPVEQKLEKPEKVKTGVVASSLTTGRPTGINVETSGSSPGDEVSAVSGSISHGKKNQCIARIINNGKKTYSVSFSVEGINKRGLKVLSRYFSATVAPKGVAERNVDGCQEDLSLSLNLKSAKALGK